MLTLAQQKARESTLEMPRYYQMLDRQHQLLDKPRWRIEYELSTAIAALVSAKDDFTEPDFTALAACVNRIVGMAHANGSGWMDFQIRVSQFFYVFGYNFDWDSKTGQFSTWPLPW